MSPPGRRHVLDRWVRRSDGGRLLAGGAPGRLIRLSAAGSAALDRLLAGEATAADDSLRDRLCGHGMLHPVAEPQGSGEIPLTFVVPSRNGGAALATLVAQLRRWGTVIVVDDGSCDGSERAAAAAGARVIANPGRGGPAGARNTGLAAAADEWVAFIDADCLCSDQWGGPLAALLSEDPELAVAAPRVASAPEAGAIGRYERTHSPLDMGPDPCRCGPGRRVGYVPSAAFVARRSALLEIGGFEEDLRFGEDVDLCLRLHAAGWSIRYAPEVEVEHRPRPTLRAFAAQRYDYGGSAAALDRRHPRQVAPVRLHRHAGAVLVAAALGGRRSPRAGVASAAAVLAGSVALAASRGDSPPARAALASVALRGHALLARYLSRAVVRDWLPVTVAACLVSSRARRLAALALAIDVAASRRRGSLPLPTSLGLRQLDHTAYAAGLWRGLAGGRSISALLPATGWAGRSRMAPSPPGHSRSSARSTSSSPTPGSRRWRSSGR